MNQLKQLLLGFACIAMFISSNATAVLLFEDDFDEPDITGQHNNFTTLDNWTITDGSVDAFVNGGFGLSCPSAGCLDLDGSTNNAVTMNTNTVFNFLSGVVYVLEVTYSGNQRPGTADDIFSFGVIGTSPITLTPAPISSGDLFTTNMLNFSYGTDQMGAIEISHTGVDNVGVILDRVRLCTTPAFGSPVNCDNGTNGVPEPGTLLLFGLGLAGLGFARRKKT